MNQYPDQGYSASYPAYQAGYTYGYQGYGQTAQYVNSTVQPGPPGEEYPQNSWTPVGGYANQQTVQTAPPSTTPTKNVEEGKKEAVAQEIQQQKSQLIKQREDYVRKVSVLKRELELLKIQKQDLLSQDSPVRDLDAIIRENEKLQDEIQSKIKAIHNVIEMLSSIIKDGMKIQDLEAQLPEDTPPELQTIKSEKVETPSDGKYNYVHYDPELHWCRVCDNFPKTAKELLLHLQTKKHQDKVQESGLRDNTPWHKLPAEPELPHYEGAPNKRVPIKGLQFFISSPSWYCKLCDTWIGDLHCASHHLKSQAHFQNYANFVDQNPHWEMEWLKDREKALSRSDKLHQSSQSEEEDLLEPKKKKKRRDKRSSLEKSVKEKKRKKHSKRRRKHSSDSSDTSSSSDSSTEGENDDKSRSIRVAMRNVKVENIMNEDLSDKWEMLGRLVEEHKKKEEEIQKAKQSDDNLISQWMTISQPPEKEKKLFDNLKDRMKQKHDAEKAKIAELERKKLEMEREERELRERSIKEAREIKEREERERKQRDLDEFQRIRDANRDQVRFRTSRDKFRKRVLSMSSDEESQPTREEQRSKREEPALKREEPPLKREEPLSKREGSSSKREEPSSKREDPHSRREDTHSRREDTHSRREDTHSRREGPYSKREDSQSRREDPYSRREESYSRREESYSRREEPYSRREEPRPRREESHLRREESYSRREESHSRREEPQSRREEPQLRREEPDSKGSQSPDDRHYGKGYTPDRFRKNENGQSDSNQRSRTVSGSSSVDKEKVKETETKNQVAIKKKPPGPPSYKKLPFIGRMPLFKNKKPEDKQEKEIKKEDYEPQRQSKFQPGNLARAFIPEPEVVCFPKLATIPPIVPPPPAPAITALPPAAPKISDLKLRKPPPPPKIYNKGELKQNIDTKRDGTNYSLYDDHMEIMSQYYPPDPDFKAMYPQMFDFSQPVEEKKLLQRPMEAPRPPTAHTLPVPRAPTTHTMPVPRAPTTHTMPVPRPPTTHTMPLPPPPLPPAGDADDLAMLGISADDMAAQSF